MFTISCSKAATVPKECHNIGASSGTTSLFLLEMQNDTQSMYRYHCRQVENAVHKLININSVTSVGMMINHTVTL